MYSMDTACKPAPAGEKIALKIVILKIIAYIRELNI